MSKPAQDFTPELIENGRYRWEETDESQDSIAADFGINRTTLLRRAIEWGWKSRKDRPPRDLSGALRLDAEVDRALLTRLEGEAAPERSPFDKSESPPAAPGSDVSEPAQAAMADELERAVAKELRTVQIMRAKLGPRPQRTNDAAITARTLQTLTDTLYKIRRLRAPETQQMTGSDDHDDMPRDIDEFRRTLARRIEAFVRSRTDGAVSEPGESPGADLPAS